MEMLIVILILLVMALLVGMVLGREQTMIAGPPGRDEMNAWQPDIVVLRRSRQLLAEQDIVLSEDDIFRLAKRSPGAYLEHLSMRELVVWFRHQVEDSENGLV